MPVFAVHDHKVKIKEKEKKTRLSYRIKNKDFGYEDDSKTNNNRSTRYNYLEH